MSAIFGKTKKPVIRTERTTVPKSNQPKNAFVVEQEARRAKFRSLAAETIASRGRKKYSETATKRELESGIRRSKTKVTGAGSLTSTTGYAGTAFLGAPRAPHRHLGAAALAVSEGLIPSFAAPTAASKAKIAAVVPTTTITKKSAVKAQINHTKKKTGIASKKTTITGKTSIEAKNTVSEKSSSEAHKKSSLEAKNTPSSASHAQIDSDLSSVHTSDVEAEEPVARRNKRKASVFVSRPASPLSDNENDEPRPAKRARDNSPVQEQRTTQEILRKETSGKSSSRSRAMAPTMSSSNKVKKTSRPKKSAAQTTTANQNVVSADGTSSFAQPQRKIKVPKSRKPSTIGQRRRQEREELEAVIAASLAESKNSRKRSRDDDHDEEVQVKRQRHVIPGLEGLSDSDSE